jgi:hypothetical protein
VNYTINNTSDCEYSSDDGTDLYKEMEKWFSVLCKFDSDWWDIVSEIDSWEVMSSKSIGIGCKLIDEIEIVGDCLIECGYNWDIVLIHDTLIFLICRFYFGGSIKWTEDTFTELFFDIFNICIITKWEMFNVMWEINCINSSSLKYGGECVSECVWGDMEITWYLIYIDKSWYETTFLVVECLVNSIKI